MTHSDEGIKQQLTEYASTLADIPEFLDQVKERLEILRVEAGKTESGTDDYQEELARVEQAHYVALVAIAGDFNAIVDLAVDAGVDPAVIRERVTSSMALENSRLNSASARAAF